MTGCERSSKTQKMTNCKFQLIIKSSVYMEVLVRISQEYYWKLGHTTSISPFLQISLTHLTVAKRGR